MRTNKLLEEKMEQGSVVVEKSL